MNTVEDLADELISRLKRPESAFNRVCAFHVKDRDVTITIDASKDKNEIDLIKDGNAVVTLSANFDLFANYLEKTPNMMTLGMHMGKKDLSISGQDQNKAIKAGFILLQSL